VKDKANDQGNTRTAQQIRAADEVITNEEQEQDRKKLRVVSLQILVIVVEFQNQLNERKN